MSKMSDWRIWLTKFHSDWQKLTFPLHILLFQMTRFSKSVQMTGMSKNISTSLISFPFLSIRATYPSTESASVCSMFSSIISAPSPDSTSDFRSGSVLLDFRSGSVLLARGSLCLSSSLTSGLLYRSLRCATSFSSAAFRNSLSLDNSLSLQIKCTVTKIFSREIFYQIVYGWMCSCKVLNSVTDNIYIGKRNADFVLQF